MRPEKISIMGEIDARLQDAEYAFLLDFGAYGR